MRAWSSAVILVAVCAACGSSSKSASDTTTTTIGTTPSTTAPAAPDKLTLTSSAFADNGTIPTKYTCTGAGDIPPLAWSEAPVGTTSLALIVHDPDAPIPGGFTHWVLTGLARVAGDLPPIPAGAHEVVAWRPPCPPPGSAPHHYRFTLYALSRPATTQDAIPGAAIAQVTLVGTYSR